MEEAISVSPGVPCRFSLQTSGKRSALAAARPSQRWRLSAARCAGAVRAARGGADWPGRGLDARLAGRLRRSRRASRLQQEGGGEAAREGLGAMLCAVPCRRWCEVCEG